jgi:hypothetical protein
MIRKIIKMSEKSSMSPIAFGYYWTSESRGKSILGILEELQIYDYELSDMRYDDGMA